MNPNHCPYCKTVVSRVEIHCEECGFPLDGTEKEKTVFLGQQVANKSKVEDAKHSLERSQIVLYVVAGFQFLNAVLVYTNFKNVLTTSILAGIGLVLCVFSYLSPIKPVLFISFSILTLLVYYAFLFWIDSDLGFHGILWKIMVLILLSLALFDAVRSKHLKKKSAL